MLEVAICDDDKEDLDKAALMLSLLREPNPADISVRRPP